MYIYIYMYKYLITRQVADICHATVGQLLDFGHIGTCAKDGDKPIVYTIYIYVIYIHIYCILMFMCTIQNYTNPSRTRCNSSTQKPVILWVISSQNWIELGRL